MRPQEITGFTLIEALIVVSIAAIIGLISLSSFNRLITDIREYNTIARVSACVDRARLLAVTRNERVGVCSLADDKRCSEDWNGNYWAEFVDANGNRQLDSGEKIVFERPRNSQVDARWSNWLRDDTITYQSNGTVVSNGTLYLSENGKTFAKLIFNKGGRLRLEKP